ncbi:VOC family protein [Saccharopolyspora thermophila]|uniref:VOC family protein n=1 Tax=Saccharopolyspora thermophila TaxID=89367 RepID=UPI001E2A8A60|nr:VOC family protein [Saccharopolyspora subtropica]
MPDMVRVDPGRWDVAEGTPCLIELVTTDVGAACEFYAGLFGWEYEAHDDPRAGTHLLAHQDGFPVASIRECDDGRSRWRLYLATMDSSATAARAGGLGGRIVVPRSRIPGLGVKLVLTSPADDEFGLLEPDDRWRFDVGLPGTLVWAELVTIKAQTADHFYGELFGYAAEQFGTEHRTGYAVWYLGEESVLARVSMIREHLTTGTRPHWLVYLGVDEEVGTDELVRQAIARGGRVRVDPYDSGLGRIAVLRDPTGARFAVVDPTQAAEYGTTNNDDPYDD